MEKNEAVFLPVNCVKEHKTFYARYDRAYGGVWVNTYGLKEMPSEENGKVSKSGMLRIDLGGARTGPQYKCPYCGNIDFVRCGACSKLTCYLGSGKFRCDHCGNTGEVTGTIESLEGDGRKAQG